MTTDSDQQTGTWRPMSRFGFSKYEISPDGFGPDQQPVRRIDTGKPIAVSLNNNGYPRVKIYDDNGKQQTCTVHSLVLLTYAGDRPKSGMQARHLDDNPFNNRWRPGGEAETRAAGGNLIWGFPSENVEDTFRNGRQRAAPRPVRYCVLCDSVLTTNGKRCHDCVVRLGEQAAGLLRGGHDPEDVAAALEYPSAEGIVKLAVVHGGYGQPRLKRWLHRVTATVRDIFHGAEEGHGK
jgi:hypothetical protein